MRGKLLMFGSSIILVRSIDHCGRAGALHGQDDAGRTELDGVRPEPPWGDVALNAAGDPTEVLEAAEDVLDQVPAVVALASLANGVCG